MCIDQNKFSKLKLVRNHLRSTMPITCLENLIMMACENGIKMNNNNTISKTSQHEFNP